MNEDPDMMRRWEALSQKANVVFAGQPMEDVGGALAMLTAMLIAGLMQDEELEGHDPRATAMAIMAKHGTLVLQLIPSFLDSVEEMGGWDNVTKKGRH